MRGVILNILYYHLRSFIILTGIFLLISSCSDNPTNSKPNLLNCLEFDGDNDLVVVDDSPSLDISQQITISVWFYNPGNFSGEPGLIQKDGPGSWGRYGLWVTNDKIDFCIFIDGGSQVCLLSTQSLTQNKWHHIAGVYDGSKMVIYIDGSVAGETNLSGNISTSDNKLYISSDPTESNALPSRIREVSLWNKARTQAEIQNEMNNSLTGTENGLVLYLKMNEGSGQVVSDKSGMGNHGQLGLNASTDDSDPKWIQIEWP